MMCDLEEPILAENLPEETATIPDEDALPPQVDATERLAADFLLLAEEFPELQSPAQVPDEVLERAVSEEISLLDAYLRYRWQEEKKVLAATRQQELAARQTTGSLSGGSCQTPPEQDAFLRAFRRAL